MHDPLRWFDPDGLARCAVSSRDVIRRGPNGEITSVKGMIYPSDIGAGTHTNSSSRAWVRQLGKATDDAGHTRPKNAGGSGRKKYVCPQDPNVNRGRFAQFEKQITNYVGRTQQSVNFEQNFQYANGGTRPTGLNYHITDLSGNTLFTRFFPNP